MAHITPAACSFVQEGYLQLLFSSAAFDDWSLMLHLPIAAPEADHPPHAQPAQAQPPGMLSPLPKPCPPITAPSQRPQGSQEGSAMPMGTGGPRAPHPAGTSPAPPRLLLTPRSHCNACGAERRGGCSRSCLKHHTRGTSLGLILPFAPREYISHNYRAGEAVFASYYSQLFIFNIFRLPGSEMEIILHLTLKLQSLLSNQMLNTKGKAFKASQFNKTKQKKKKKEKYSMGKSLYRFSCGNRRKAKARRLLICKVHNSQSHELSL